MGVDDNFDNFTNLGDPRMIIPNNPGIIEMQPLIGPRVSSADSTNNNLINRLSMLIPHDVLYIEDRDTDDDDAVLITDGNGTTIFKCDKTPISGTQRNSSSVGGSMTNFLNEHGQIIFSSERREMCTHITSEDFVLGEVLGDVCGCDRSFTAKNSIDNQKFTLRPVGFWASIGWSCCNSCCMEEYFIYNYPDEETPIGRIKAGDKIQITLAPGMDVKNKAVLLAGSVLIHELYFQDCFGRVGIMGSRYICVYGFIALVLLFGVILFVVALYKNSD